MFVTFLDFLKFFKVNIMENEIYIYKDIFLKWKNNFKK